VAQARECLLEALSSNPSPTKKQKKTSTLKDWQVIIINAVDGYMGI
jgi:hypothetical protein